MLGAIYANPPLACMAKHAFLQKEDGVLLKKIPSDFRSESFSKPARDSFFQSPIPNDGGPNFRKLVHTGRNTNE